MAHSRRMGVISSALPGLSGGGASADVTNEEEEEEDGGERERGTGAGEGCGVENVKSGRARSKERRMGKMRGRKM